MRYDPEAPQHGQTASWTCSAASLAWLLRSLGVPMGEWGAVDAIGDGVHISSGLGLHDGSGARLKRVIEDRGFEARIGWLNWHEALGLAGKGPMLIGGQGWYHWSGVRRSDWGVDEIDGLWLANPAHNWRGVGQFMTYPEWVAWGPFAYVRVPVEGEDMAEVEELKRRVAHLEGELAMRVRRDEELITTMGYIHGDVVAALRKEVGVLRGLGLSDEALSSVGALEAATNTLDEHTKP